MKEAQVVHASKHLFKNITINSIENKIRSISKSLHIEDSEIQETHVESNRVNCTVIIFIIVCYKQQE